MIGGELNIESEQVDSSSRAEGQRLYYLFAKNAWWWWLATLIFFSEYRPIFGAKEKNYNPSRKKRPNKDSKSDR